MRGGHTPAETIAWASWAADYEDKFTEVDAMVTVEFNEADSAWRSYCQACTSTQWYWFQPDLIEETAAGDLVPVRRRGNVLYDYELARGPVPA